LNDSLPDTVRLKALLSLGVTNYRFDSLLYFQSQFEQVVNEKSTPVDLIEFDLQKGGAHIRMDQFEAALACFERAERRAAEIKDTMRLLRAIGWQGNYYGSINQTNLSIEKYLEAKVLAE
jgi:tetratricopeptide (TPR) repeat protein